MQVGVGEGVVGLEDLEGLQDPEEDLLQEGQADDQLDGDELVDGLELGLFLLDGDGDADDGADGEAGRQGVDDLQLPPLLA